MILNLLALDEHVRVNVSLQQQAMLEQHELAPLRSVLKSNSFVELQRLVPR
jgi:hypothetical protein